MGTLIGFAFGYYLGLKEKPERAAELQTAFGEILESREVQALMGTAQTALSGLMTRVGEATQGQSGGDLGQAWRTISESAEFKAILAGGTALFQDMARRAGDAGDPDRASEESAPGGFDS